MRTIGSTNQINNRIGLLFYSHEPSAVTFQGGYLCVKAPQKRTPKLTYASRQ